MDAGTPLGWHVMMRLVDDRVIAPDRAARRMLATRLLAEGRAGGLLAFRVVDTHVHLLALGPRVQVLRMVLAFERGVRPRLAVGWHPVHLVPVHDQHHLERAFHYVLRNEARHGLGADPLQDGSALADLLGLRATGLYLPDRVRRHLPRVTREQLLAHLGVDRLEPSEVPTDLVDATLGAFGLPELRGALAGRARRAAALACPELSTRSLAPALGVDRRTMQRARAAGVPPGDVRAVRLQLALRLARGVGATPRSEPAAG